MDGNFCEEVIRALPYSQKVEAILKFDQYFLGAFLREYLDDAPLDHLINCKPAAGHFQNCIDISYHFEEYG